MSNKNSISKIAQPYGEALIDLAVSSNTLDNVTNDIKSILNLISESPELKKIIISPLIDNNKKKNILSNILKSQISNTTLKFIMLVIDRVRFVLLEEIGRQFLELAYEKTGITLANIATSIPFSEQQYSLWIQTIKLLKNDKRLIRDINIDPELIGGFTIQLGSQLIDSSLKGQLKQMASHLDILEE
uniref:ATP synthase subunit delta, chloroplastic n=1 Tax=Flintiella sanguinaria TaxID=101926 RepID=A0A1X9PU80_9RHOD|nr:ATP synthase CF1 subunit delta [Flintiella sanguinaria]